VQRVADDDSALAQVTGARNRIFVVTDGSAILGLGDVGPRARPAPDGGQGRPVQATGRRRCLAAAAALAAAADAVACLVDEPGPQAIVPDVFDERLVDRVATAVVDYAQEVQVPWMRSD
jgi:malic enzyme